MNTTKSHLKKLSNIKFISAINAWASTHRKQFWAICIIAAFVIGGGISFAVLSNTSKNADGSSTSKTNSKKKAEPIKYYSPLTGVEVATKELSTGPVTAVMIPNDTYGARPQAGLKGAGVVFEAICEGGITRFLALFQSDKPELIGPIRSVRMYYISWAAAFNAGIVHYGGNIDALAEIRNGNYRDLDQMLNNSASWRDPSRTNPDDAFTSSARLDELNAAKGYTTSEFTGFKREAIVKPTAATTAPSTTTGTTTDTTTATATPTFPAATNINIHISGFDFDSSYIYDAATNTYARSQAGAPHLDTAGSQIAPSVVIAMNVEENSSPYPENHEEITTIGSGAAKIFQNGVVIEGTWSKPSQFEQITFADANGVEIPLVRGQTWITAVPNAYGTVDFS